MAKDVVGKGTRLQCEIGTALVDVAQIYEITPPNAEVEMFDATTLDSSDGWKEHYSTGFTEPGELSFSVFFDPALAGHDDLRQLLTTRDVKNWNLIYTDGSATEDAFTGTLTKFDPTVVMNDGVKATINVKLTGAIDMNAA